MKNVIRRAAFVDANALLKDECSVEYKEPSQAQYYALFKDHYDAKAVDEALKHVADMIKSPHPGSRLSVKRRQTALKTYTMTLNERVSKASIKSSRVSLRALLPGTRMPTR